jgi:hypothetical protein
MKLLTDPFTAGKNPFDELEEFFGTQTDGGERASDPENKAALHRTMERVIDWLKRNPVLTKVPSTHGRQ